MTAPTPPVTTMWNALQTLPEGYLEAMETNDGLTVLDKNSKLLTARVEIIQDANKVTQIFLCVHRDTAVNGYKFTARRKTPVHLINTKKAKTRGKHGALIIAKGTINGYIDPFKKGEKVENHDVTKFIFPGEGSDTVTKFYADSELMLPKSARVKYFPDFVEPAATQSRPTTPPPRYPSPPPRATTSPPRDPSPPPRATTPPPTKKAIKVDRPQESPSKGNSLGILGALGLLLLLAGIRKYFGNKAQVNRG